MKEGSIYKPRAISGYPEWLPEYRAVELSWLDSIRKVFESFGYCSIETPAVEELQVLTSKGESSDKEIYCISRLNGEEKNAELGLHYDLTVPFARYVAQHYNDLDFPFKRYQMQKVWRGERPQEGRFREFYQCDVDVVNHESLPLFFDIEIATIMYQALLSLPLGPLDIKLSNRKILEGFLAGLKIENPNEAIRVLDKLDKIGVDGVYKILNQSLSEEQSKQCLELAKIQSNNFVKEVTNLGVKNDTLSQGLDELSEVFSALDQKSFSIDLSIARGFDYYSGTIFEAKLKNYPHFSTVAAGGRYDKLASSFIKQDLPGIGMSIGLTRIFSKLLAEGKIEAKAKSPTQVLVSWLEADQKEKVQKISEKLRAKGINVEAYHCVDKLKKQIKYADRKGISYIIFPASSLNPKDEVKNMQTGEQTSIDIENWTI